MPVIWFNNRKIVDTELTDRCIGVQSGEGEWDEISIIWRIHKFFNNFSVTFSLEFNSISLNY
jgi:hypothetical protein